MKAMRRIVAVLLVAAMLLSAAAMAETYVKFRENARGYKKAGGKKTDVIIKKGSISFTEADDIDGKWAKIYVDEDTSLWFETKFLKETDDEDVRVMYVSGGGGRSAYNDDEGIHSYKTGKKYVYATGRCNIRKTPELDGKKIGSMKKGTKLRYLGKRGEDDRGVYWYKVRTESGKTGWVSEVYTKLK